MTIAHLLVAWNSLYDPSGPIYYILLLIFGVVVKICPKPILCILEIFFTVSKKFPWIILYQTQLLFPVKTAETWLRKIQKKPMLQFDMRWFRNFFGVVTEAHWEKSNYQLLEDRYGYNFRHSFNFYPKTCHQKRIKCTKNRKNPIFAFWSIQKICNSQIDRMSRFNFQNYLIYHNKPPKVVNRGFEIFRWYP